MMSRNYFLFAVTLAVGLFLSGCSRDDAALPDEGGNISHPTAWSLQVSAAGFRSATGTRADDSELSTTFASGDVLGLIVTHNGTIEHIPYRYNGSVWSAVSGATYYYDSKSSYAAYFPYREGLQGKTLDDVKAAFTPLIDQADREKGYCASDLLVCSSITRNSAGKTLQIAFTHAHALLRVTPNTSFTGQYGPNVTDITTFTFTATVSDPIIAVDGTPYRPWIDGSGYARLIIPHKSSDCVVNSQYTVRGRRMQNTIPLSAPTAGHCYTVTTTDNLGYYTLSCARAGDFYIKNNDGNDYLIPGEVQSLKSEEKNNCIGVVFYAGDITGDNYGLLNSKFPDGTHGLVAALNNLTDPDNANEQKMAWTYGETESVSDVWLQNATWQGDIPRPDNFTNIYNRNMQGYANTIALQEYNKVKEASETTDDKDYNRRVKPIYALAKFATNYPAPQSSSGWYWPSCSELMLMCWGQGNGQSDAGRNMLNAQFDKVSGQRFTGSPTWIYLPSTETSIYPHNAWGVYFNNGDVKDDKVGKWSSEYLVRPVLAF